ncbi:Hsp20/alpha crystallin family protein [Pelagicoccus sp. NFK12]|uniref:Hsp20/alpha crystallin family protein n=1 Tax=Pelagicoccus enzymogenes TaxID=2773457 RepID=A0A927FBB8_9BACT|nr:Hsp20/alpha crystallin family protein [Pelagicoccus enzymogenes]MBD5781211.1 Hsp20/alpha crystallin family protein [Pelagicoccus enzymogenes]MDQ8198887.1 Hsp20/alpha crystallin family protein [Pelagicoccus enzymogenes]
MTNQLIPQHWKESLGELREEIGETVDRWISRLKPEQRKEAKNALAEEDPFWNPIRFGGGPRIEMEESDTTIKIVAELPGLAKEDFQVDLDDRYLTIRGEKSGRNERKEGHLHISECSYGSFTRVIPLPCEVERDKVKAKYKNGELRLVLPKTESAKARRIEISVE